VGRRYTDPEHTQKAFINQQMGRNNWFEFKQFRIEQQNAAMKVGTDGVLLGAWTPVGGADRILDVGTGTGLIALMVAQRSAGEVDAVEIDMLASDEAKFNFKHSPWSDRLTVFNTDFLDFYDLHTGQYDLIVCNPPFFINSMKSQHKASAVARHNQKLTFSQLIVGSRKLLHDDGRLCVIIPFESLLEFKELARLSDFFLHFRTDVFPRAGGAPKRVLLEFTRSGTYPVHAELQILDENGLYTEKYKALTSPFYPAF